MPRLDRPCDTPHRQPRLARPRPTRLSHDVRCKASLAGQRPARTRCDRLSSALPSQPCHAGQLLGHDTVCSAQPCRPRLATPDHGVLGSDLPCRASPGRALPATQSYAMPTAPGLTAPKRALPALPSPAGPSCAWLRQDLLSLAGPAPPRLAVQDRATQRPIARCAAEPCQPRHNRQRLATAAPSHAEPALLRLASPCFA
jgi:hypothetical protein